MTTESKAPAPKFDPTTLIIISGAIVLAIVLGIFLN